MNKTDVHPNAVLEAILAKGHRSHKINNLRALHDICERHYNQQSLTLRDFSLASIGRLCEEKGLFKGRILYNLASEDYVKLITAWAAFSGPASVKVRQREVAMSSSYAFLLRIEDPSIRSVMQTIIVERDKLKQQINILKSTTYVVVNQQPLGATLPKGSKDTALLETKAQLTNSERIALKNAISSEFLDGEGWTIGEDGEILKGQRMLYEPGYCSSIRKVLGE